MADVDQQGIDAARFKDLLARVHGIRLWVTPGGNLGSQLVPMWQAAAKYAWGVEIQSQGRERAGRYPGKVAYFEASTSGE